MLFVIGDVTVDVNGAKDVDHIVIVVVVVDEIVLFSGDDVIDVVIEDLEVT